MDSEIKWMFCVFIVFIVALTLGDSYSEYARKECVREYASTNRSVEDIEKLCRK